MESSIGVLLGIALKTAFLFATAALVTALMRRRSAAARHIVWALAMGGALVLPAVSAVVPVWSISVPYSFIRALAPSSTVSASVADISETRNRSISDAAVELPQVPPALDAPHSGSTRSAHASRSGATAPQSAQSAQSVHSAASVSSPKSTSGSRSQLSELATSPLSWPEVALFVWLVGMLVVAAQYVGSALAAHRLIRRAAVVTDERWSSLLSRTKVQLSLRRRVLLLQSERVTTPAAWGVFHPAVVVPAAADGWNDVQRHAVLLHELAHVERWDCLTHMLAELACAVHWFNPLAWWAKHRLNTERERACDDRALGQMTPPSSYAEQLMTVAYLYQGWHREPVGSLPMAKPSQLEDRVRRILDRALQRGANTRSATMRLGSITACFVVSIAAVHPHVGAELDPVQPMVQHMGATVLPDTLTSSTNDVHWNGTLSPGDTIAISNLTGEIRAEPAQGNRIEVVAQRHSERDDPKTVTVHIERHAHKMLLCSVYPRQLSKNCDSYEFSNNGGDSRGCGGGGGHCGSDVEVDWVVRVPANIRLSTSTIAGNITATGLQNDITAKSVGGHIDISTAGHVVAWSMSRVNVAMGRTDWSGDLRLYAGSGLTVTLPANADTRVEAISTFGKLESDFPLQQASRGSFGAQATGMLGHGGRTLQLKTLGGPITLRSAAVTHVAATNNHIRVPRRGTSHRSIVRMNVDSLGDPPLYVTVDHSDIAAIVREAMDRANIAGTVTASLSAADIPGTVEKAIKAARIDEKVREAMRAAFGDSTTVRLRPPQ